MKARWAPYVNRFTSMFTCMCQVNLSTDRSARGSYRVRAIMMLAKDWLAVMYASQLVYVLHKKHKGGRLEQPQQSANHQEPASSANSTFRSSFAYIAERAAAVRTATGKCWQSAWYHWWCKDP